MSEEPDVARQQVQRLAFRCICRFLVDEANNLAVATDGDVIDGLIFAAVNQRRGLGVTGHGIAASVGVPAETVRRKVLRLVQAGLIDRAEDGSLTTSPRALEPQRKREQPTVDNFMNAAGALKSLGFAPHIFVAPAIRSGIDLSEAAAIIDTMMLRSVERAQAFYGSIARALIFILVMYLNSLDLTYDPTLAWRYSSFDAPPPDELRRPVHALQVAQAVRLPRETVRRQMNALLAMGHLERRAGGFLASRAFQERPEILDYGRATVLAFEHVVRDLVRAGWDLSDLPSPPPIAEPLKSRA